jgi:hypothetical protein
MIRQGHLCLGMQEPSKFGRLPEIFPRNPVLACHPFRGNACAACRMPARLATVAAFRHLEPNHLS